MNKHDTNNNFGELKQIILQYLSDYQIHNADEIVMHVNNKLAPKVISKSHIYTAISQLINHNIPIVKISTGTYRMKEDEPGIIQNTQSFLVKQLTDCKEYLQRELCFELSSSEYLQLKEFYDEIQQLINNISNG